MATNDEKISPSEWVSVATTRISQLVLHNGPENKNKAFEGSGILLQNYIGFALGLPFNTINPEETWTLDQQEKISHGKLLLYKDSSLDKIDKFINAMYGNCLKQLKVTLYIIPMFYYDKSKQQLNELFVMKFSIESQSGFSFIDIMGRVYKTFDLFLANNKLPVGQICYPNNGEFETVKDGTTIKCGVRECGSVFSAIDIGIGVVGAFGTVGLSFASGGALVPFICVSFGSAAYGTGRGIATLFDRGEHRQSINPFTDRDARIIWLGISANLVSFTALGARYALAKQATNGGNAKIDSNSVLAASVNILQYASNAINGATAVDEVLYLIEKWSTLPTNEKIMMAASICFHMRCAISFQNADQVIADARSKTITSVLAGPNFGDEKVMEILKCFNTNNGLIMAKEIFKKQIKVKTDPENYTIIFFDKFEFKIRNLIGFRDEKDVTTLFDMICSFISTASNVLKIVFSFFGEDVQIVRALEKERKEKKLSWKEMGMLATELINFLKTLNLNSIKIQDMKMTFGRGVLLTIGEAYDILRICGINRAKEILYTIFDMSKDDCVTLNQIINKCKLQNLLEQWKNETNIKKAFQTLLKSQRKGLIDLQNTITEKNIFSILLELSDKEITAFRSLIDRVGLQNIIDTVELENDSKNAVKSLTMIQNNWRNPMEIIEIYSTEKNIFYSLVNLSPHECDKFDLLMRKLGKKETLEYVKSEKDVKSAIDILLKGQEKGLLNSPVIFTEKTIFHCLLEMTDDEVESFVAFIYHVDSKTILNAIKLEKNPKRTIKNLIKVQNHWKNRLEMVKLFNTEKNIFGCLINLDEQDLNALQTGIQMNYFTFDEIVGCVKHKNKKFETEAIRNLINVLKADHLRGSYNKRHVRLLPEGGILFKSKVGRYTYSKTPNTPSPHFAVKLHTLKNINPEQMNKFVDSTFIETCLHFCPDKNNVIKSMWIESFLIRDEFMLSILHSLEKLLSNIQRYTSVNRAACIFSFVFQMEPKYITDFYYCTSFAYEQTSDSSIDPDLLVQSYRKLINKVIALNMDGFERIDPSLNDDQLVEAFKNLAREKKLKFGYVGNAVIHAHKCPDLRMQSGLIVMNNILCMKEFRMLNIVDENIGKEKMRVAHIQIDPKICFKIVLSKTGQVYIENFEK